MIIIISLRAPAAGARMTNLCCENMKGTRLYHVNFDKRTPAFRHRLPFPHPFDALLMHPFPRGARYCSSVKRRGRPRES